MTLVEEAVDCGKQMATLEITLFLKQNGFGEACLAVARKFIPDDYQLIRTLEKEIG